MIAAPMLVTLSVLVNSSRLGFLVIRNTLMVSFINLFTLLGCWISSEDLEDSLGDSEEDEVCSSMW